MQYLTTCTKSELITDQATPQRQPVISYRCFWASILINNDKKVHLLDNNRGGRNDEKQSCETSKTHTTLGKLTALSYSALAQCRTCEKHL